MTLMDTSTAMLSSLLFPKLQSYPEAWVSALSALAGDGRILHFLHRAISLSLDFLFSLLILLLSNVPSPLRRPHAGVAAHGSPQMPADPSPAAGTSSARALANVLFAVSRVPVSSRKYDLVRGLADRLIDGNLRSARDGAGAPALEGLNRVVLASAFAGTLHRLELAATAAAAPRDRTKGGVLGAVRSRIRWAGATTALMTAEDQTSGEGETPEKTAAEALWLAQKMEECGAAGEAAAMWGAASRLGGLAVSAEPRLQVVLVQLSSFLLRHANSKQMEEGRVPGEEEEEEAGGRPAVARVRMGMLTSWLPLLCRACNGSDGAPVMSSREKAEMVGVLEEMIAKLCWEDQEEVLALWLHHFASCPDSDWPNLESYYTKWYSESRRLVLKWTTTISRSKRKKNHALGGNKEKLKR